MRTAEYAARLRRNRKETIGGEPGAREESSEATMNLRDSIADVADKSRCSAIHLLIRLNQRNPRFNLFL